jgi:hypothetical protein
MKSKILLTLMAVLLSFGVMGTPVSAAYTANYTISDISPITVDIIGTGMAETKSQVPSLVQLGVLAITIGLLSVCLLGVVALFTDVPKKLGITGGVFKRA